jgi:hypothetical protein
MVTSLEAVERFSKALAELGAREDEGGRNRIDRPDRRIRRRSDCRRMIDVERAEQVLAQAGI